MSFIIFTVKCEKCGKVVNTSFGVVNSTVIADPVNKCVCGGELKSTRTAEGAQDNAD
jgi:hypothetical protein